MKKNLQKIIELQINDGLRRKNKIADINFAYSNYELNKLLASRGKAQIEDN